MDQDYEQDTERKLSLPTKSGVSTEKTQVAGLVIHLFDTWVGISQNQNCHLENLYMFSPCDLGFSQCDIKSQEGIPREPGEPGRSCSPL